ncbi:MAG TPA: DUF4783 domain-containing protein [Bacteroidales bacterium]|nr:DUF4783 domain-containing protein [Bacteroidales bacterium]HRR48809.1 DUF4783 domain-containing protein [Bacteroidales bacterium]HRT33105.1 DUF4783 domain-containing protein [Bacteroidales bacterium]HRT83123.1 DUF4783 domain-containing protein [Bacteroidales bacterium]
MNIFLFAIISSFFTFSSPATQYGSEQDVFVPIAKYIQSGDAEKLSAWFAPNLEVDILGTVNVCSKTQAKQIIKEFFANNSPKSFVIEHRSGKAPLKYAIGTLSAGGSKFRVTLFVKTQEDGNFIQQIRIEME